MARKISFRVDEELSDDLERRGRDRHEVARQAFLEAAERLRREAVLERLEAGAKEPEEPAPDSGEPGRP